MAVISRLFGAAIRGVLILLLIVTPALLLPGTSQDTAQIVMLLGLFAAALTFVEYASAYPCLFEFRDAPPFNRLRFVSLFVMISSLTVMSKGVVMPSGTSQLLQSVGLLFGNLIDFPYSPVKLAVLMLPEQAPMLKLTLLRASAGLAYLISIIALVVFYMTLRLRTWPLQTGSFNVWVNLPTFDPTSGGDVVSRLRRDSWINIALGALLPFLMPTAVSTAAGLFGAVSLEHPQTLIWTVAAWAFLPASLIMRGLAMGRIAAMIAEKRKVRAVTEPGMLPA